MLRLGLRWQFTLFIVFVVLGQSLANFYFGTTHLNNDIEQDALHQGRKEISRLSHTIEYLLNRQDLARVQEEIVALGTDPELKMLFLVSDQQQVLASIHRADIDDPLSKLMGMVPAEQVELIMHFMSYQPKPKRGEVRLTADHDHLIGIYPIDLPLEPEMLRSSRQGYLVMWRSLKETKYMATESLFHDLWPIIFVLVMLSLLLWGAIQLLVVDRLLRMARAAQAISKGDYDTRVAIKGQDELGRLGEVFDEMAQRVQYHVAQLEQARLESARSEAKYRRLVESLETDYFVYSVNTEGVFVYVSPSINNVLGYEQDEFLHFRGKYLTDSSINKGSLAYGEAGLKGKKQPSYEVEMWHKDGRRCILKITEVPVTQQGQVVGLEGIAHDITLQKQAYDSLQEAQHIAHIGNWEMDWIHGHLFWSDEVYRILGFAPQTISPSYRTFLRLVHLHDRDEILNKYRESIQSKDAFHYDHRIIRVSDKVVRYIHERWRHYWDSHGNIIRSVGTIQDITEQQQAAIQLEALQRYLQSVFDSMPSILVGVDAKCRIQHWNAQAEAQTGISESAALRQKVDKVLPILSGRMSQIGNAITNSQPHTLEKQRYLHRGELHFVDIVIYPLLMKSVVVGAVIRIDDVTERVLLEQVMMQTEKMMSIGGLAAGMAHEINNPLGGILQGVQNIQRRLSSDLEKNHEVAEQLGLDLNCLQKYLQQRQIPKFIDGVRAAGERASTIVNNMLQFSRKSVGEMEKVSLLSLLDSTLELASVDYDLKKRYDFRTIRIVKEYQPGLSPVPCIPSEIQQVLLNILRNAAQAMQARGTNELPQITVRVYESNGWQYIELEDNGPGMTEEVRHRVFEPFFTTRPPGEGTGLGLSVSYYIVHDEHHGRLIVESSVGKGTLFKICLPLQSGQ